MRYANIAFNSSSLNLPIDSTGIGGSNKSPDLAWTAGPSGTQSYAIVFHDLTNVMNNKPFVHWVMADIPASVRELAAGSCSDGFVVKGKTTPAGPAGSRQGLNDFTGWFAGNPDMAGDYLGYDGPYPPFNDERVHRYFFRVFALDVASLQLPARFTAADAYRAMHGHVLAEATLHGTYTLNPALA